ncbi:MAG: translation initiation factor 2 [Oscillospiraceae bacterium]|nr:translation initiation factor 2 [Oscillospiraceae bacterium]
MVKGISKQVIVVHSPDPQLFEQAIFILSEDALSREGVTEELLLKEAKSLIGPARSKRQDVCLFAGVWAAAGAFATALVWFMSTVF